MDNFPETIAAIEADLKRAGIPIKRMFDLASCHASNWARWKGGDVPSGRLWLAVTRAHAELISAAAAE